MQATEILETSLFAVDLPAAEAFYTKVLGLELHSRKLPRHLFFRCGRSMLLIFNPEVTAAEIEKLDNGDTIPAQGAIGPGHVAFTMTEAEVEPWRQHLRACGVQIDQDVAWPSGGRSLYFRDPAGNHLELVTRSVWQVV